MQISDPIQLRELIHFRSSTNRVLIITDTCKTRQYATLFTHPADFVETTDLNPQLVKDSIATITSTNLHTIHTHGSLPIVAVIGRHLITEIVIETPETFRIMAYDNPSTQSQIGIG